jgi:phosphate transport system protein
MDIPHPPIDSRKARIDAHIDNMFGEVKDRLDRALDCLTRREAGACEALIRADVALNEEHRRIESDCLEAIACQQPVAHDLRDVIAYMRIAEELERIGDYASDIGATILGMDDTDLGHLGLPEVRIMADLCQRMLSQVRQAHAEGDTDLVLRTSALDDELDARMLGVKQGLLEAMRADAANVRNGSCMLWIAHNLERCGDRATNIAEQVVFRVRGQIVELN